MAPSKSCSHKDIYRSADGIRCCLACGEWILEKTTTANTPGTTHTAGSNILDVSREYQYRPLNYKLGQEIRLLELYPGVHNDPLVCDLIHVNILDEPSYEALSYTWATENGDATMSQEISCQGLKIPVTKNCDLALRRLRSRGIKRTLWVDAICIHQDSIAERNHQVAIMGNIYANAHRVLIFPGEIIYSYPYICSWLQKSGRHKVKEEQLWQLAELLDARWFNRVWVVQEVALAKEAVILFHKWSLPISEPILTSLRENIRIQGLTVPGPLQWCPGKFQSLDLLTCLSNARTCLSSNPKDKVFAILSLVEPSLRKLVPIDYSWHVEEIYTLVAVLCILSQNSLEILEHLGEDRTEIDSEQLSFRPTRDPSSWGLPSWVPDWRKDRPSSCSRLANMDVLARDQWRSSLGLEPNAASERLLPLYFRSKIKGSKINGRHPPSAIEYKAPTCFVDWPIISSTRDVDLLPDLKVSAYCLGRFQHNQQDLAQRFSILEEECLVDLTNTLRYQLPSENPFCQDYLPSSDHQDRYMPVWLALSTAEKYAACYHTLAATHGHINHSVPVNSAHIDAGHHEIATTVPYNLYMTAQSTQSQLDKEKTHKRSFVNVTRLEKFREAYLKESSSKQFILTENAVWYTNNAVHGPGKIFAIDGVETPFILREFYRRTDGATGHAHKIVSPCSLFLPPIHHESTQESQLITIC